MNMQVPIRPAAHRPPPWSRRSRLILLAVVVIVVAIGAFHARPPSELVIETGPVGGSYYVDAQRYQKLLAERGVDVQIRPNPSSLEIVRDVGNPASGVDVGFVAQDVSGSRHANLLTVGQIELQPLFIFASAELGRRAVLDDLRGRRIVMPPSDSATSDAAIRVFKLYDITQENSQFSFMPLADAVKALRAGKFDAGVFMLAPDNAAIRELVGDSGLHLIPITEVKAIANHLPFLQPVVLPRGIYSIADAIPPNNTPMVAAPISLVVRKGLDPYLVYSLLDAMTDVHSGATFISAAGDFPALVGGQLPPEPLAAQYYRSGVPWIYRELSPWPASIVARYQLLLGFMLLLGVLYISTICVIEMVTFAGTLLGLSHAAHEAPAADQAVVKSTGDESERSRIRDQADPAKHEPG